MENVVRNGIKRGKRPFLRVRVIIYLIMAIGVKGKEKRP